MKTLGMKSTFHQDELKAELVAESEILLSGIGLRYRCAALSSADLLPGPLKSAKRFVDTVESAVVSEQAEKSLKIAKNCNFSFDLRVRTVLWLA